MSRVSRTGEVDKDTPLLPSGKFHWIADEEEEVTFHLTNVIDQDDRVVINRTESDSQMCTYEVYYEEEPDTESWEPRAGCPEGVASQTHIHSLAVIVPEAFYFPMLLDAANRGRILLELILADLQLELRKHPNDPKLRLYIDDLGNTLTKRRPSDDECSDDVVRTLLEKGEFGILKSISKTLGSNPAGLAVKIGLALQDYGLNEMLPVLDHLWTLQSSADGALGHASFLMSICITLSGGIPGDQPVPVELRGWLNRTLNTLLSRVELRRVLGDSEVRPLALMAIVFAQPAFDEIIVPFALSLARRTAFIVVFLTRLTGPTLREKALRLGPDAVRLTYHNISPAFLNDLTLLAHRDAHLVRLIGDYHVMGLNIADLFEAVEKSLCKVLKEDASGVYDHFLHDLIVLFIRYFNDRSDKDGFTMQGSNDARFIGRILRLYRAAYVGPSPQTPTDWRQSLPDVFRRCCMDCLLLCQFIEHPTRAEQTFRLNMNKKRRDHMISKLSNTLRHEPAGSGAPYGLRVIKTNGWYLGRKTAWIDRAKRAEDQLNELKARTTLAELIGEGTFQEIFSFVRQVPESLESLTQIVPATRLTNVLQPIEPKVEESSISMPLSTIPSKRPFIKIEKD
ncbi:hypothetical protein BJX70DRAFT_401070 [Aspergillus crustosus]